VTEVTGLHHVQVAAPVGCEDAARRFYGELLGLREIEKPPLLAVRGGCWFSLGQGELHVGVEEPFRPATKAHPALAVESNAALDTLAAALTLAGIEVRWADEAEIPGQRRFFVSDPWGNRLELVVPTGTTR
jgi:catechol 2,3-dioxygenase-like lactoylglutathione lyase family enzyme